MSEEGWEARMAAQSHARKARREEVEAAAWRRRWAAIERKALASRAAMTLGEATTLRRAELVACACVGPPFCCRYSFIQAEALHRAAHIAVKLLADAADADEEGGADG